MAGFGTKVVIDLTLDDDDDNTSPVVSGPSSTKRRRGSSSAASVTMEEPSNFDVRCRILDMFPDICLDYLREMFARERAVSLSGSLLLDVLVTTIVETNGRYPKKVPGIRVATAIHGRKRKLASSPTRVAILSPDHENGFTDADGNAFDLPSDTEDEAEM